jgi:hypothetical protein
MMYPQVWAFDARRKLSNGQFAYAPGGANRFSINGELSNDITAYGNSYLAAARFYAWADTNHGPIKSIRIDWGDGSDFETSDGKYKNHKPLCAPSNSTGMTVCQSTVVDAIGSLVVYGGATCSGADLNCPGVYNIAQRTEGGVSGVVTYGAAPIAQTCSATPIVTFGNAPDACEERYFEFQHVYTCNTGAGCGPYQPRIWVTDNWGIDNSFVWPENNATGARNVFNAATGPRITIIPSYIMQIITGMVNPFVINGTVRP